MEKLTFKQQLALAIVAGVFMVLAALISKSDDKMEFERTHSSQIVYDSPEDRGSSSSVNISTSDNRVVSTNNSNAVVVNGNVIQGNNIQLK